MYYLCGKNEVIENIKYISKFNTCDLNDKQLKIHYLDFLEKNSVFKTNIGLDKLQLITFPKLKSIAPKYFYEKNSFYGDNSIVLNERINSGFFQEAIESLQKIDYEIYAIMQFIIKVIIVNHLKSFTNGTTINTIGLASIDFKDHFNKTDFIELLIHQLIHMLFFIDHFRSPHVLANNMNVMVETNLPYRLGGTKFPIYLAFHSFMVGIEMLCFRHKSNTLEFHGNYHGTTQRILKVCSKFKICLQENLHLFEINGKKLIEKACILLSHFNDFEFGLSND